MSARCANAQPACGRCAHWADDRALLEARIAGLASLGSAYGESVGESRLCLVHDRLVMPRDRCAAFMARSAEHEAAFMRLRSGQSQR
ncbi:hypothetical protein [Caballeronia ptereochthonis]|uniref:Uncharacterized protein n=1 Tax=Caballeronia ptereochthonis TaxID=1777144 RepID=A0A158D9I5_9BURK|nr:hypothetical protein [Caballeronia ptereochthonis]SAK91332.1 hypothetical protein AWB83_05203 [Caballeronia ptereochthonis]